jgi:hypothetical protein
MTRFFFLFTFFLAPVACSGSNSGNLFAPQCSDPRATTCASTDPSDPTGSGTGEATPDGAVLPGTPPPPPGHDGGTKDAAPSDADPVGQPCGRDVECATGLCNWKTEQCSSPAPNGALCDRDVECLSALCNWRLGTCADRGGNGTPCDRDSECATAVCNWKLGQCSAKGASGAPCERDTECLTGICNSALSTCK